MMMIPILRRIERNETEEAVDDFRAGHEQLDLNDEDIPERGQLPIRIRGWPRSRSRSKSCSFDSAFAFNSQSQRRRTVHNARQIDEANGWSYKPIEHLPENPVFKIYVRLCLQLMNIQRNSTVFQSFPRLFGNFSKKSIAMQVK
ncbi:hypothetical protein EVAR_86876_1 [Eumeta japonica]|uniref:Uncharacterized protein n=1 Tax=Eumeta variegata TaxID=151549 RepID=A0A4C1ZJJ6_EUMVA|nr:hypothetical protein EVAR_86876_1 [Eumeta japonica]